MGVYADGGKLRGLRFELSIEDARYPQILRGIARPPRVLYALGDLDAFGDALAVVGARRATPYGVGCAKRFASMAAERGVVVVSGGARGCDAAAHEAALAAGGRTVVVLGGGVDEPYPAEHVGLFQRVVNAGGLILSEHAWGVPPLPYAFRERNRIISGLAKATLIVEAGLPSGTFSTADAALSQGREVLVVPGAITSSTSRGANRLIYQGAHPVIDDETFEDALFGLFGCLRQESFDSAMALGDALGSDSEALAAFIDCKAAVEVMGEAVHGDLLAMLKSEPLSMDGLLAFVSERRGGDSSLALLMLWLAEMQKVGAIAQYPDGTFGPKVGVR